MKYALVNNERVEAQKGMKGFCPVCQKPVIARCGDIKVNHWAHTKSAHCDKWWESETEWHRAWKNHFPEEWQEVIAFDEETGEKHVADIKTDKGLVIEFQHSHIKPEEQKSREDFYKNMIWIVDGARLKRDFPRFTKAFNCSDITRIGNDIHLLHFPDEYLSKNWLKSDCPVIFDYQNCEIIGVKPTFFKTIKNRLWCLLPIRATNFVVIIPISKEDLLQLINNGLFFNYQIIIDTIKKHFAQRQQIYTATITKRGRKWNL